MVKVENYDHIMFIILSGQLTLEETETLAEAIAAQVDAHGEIYMLGIPVNMTGFPTKLSDMIKVSNVMRHAQNQVKRVYGIKYNPIFSFITGVSTQLLRLKNNTVEADTIDDLFRIIESETALFPNLKTSWERHGATIKASLAKAQQELTGVG